jgi:hypothetical protein
MSSLRDLPPLPDCSSYADWKELQQALDNWAVGSKFTYRVERKTPNKARYVCRIAECPWRVNVSRSTDGMLELRVTQRQHTCIEAAIAKRSSFSKKEWLDEAVTQHLLVTRKWQRASGKMISMSIGIIEPFPTIVFSSVFSLAAGL